MNNRKIFINDVPLQANYSANVILFSERKSIFLIKN